MYGGTVTGSTCTIRLSMENESPIAWVQLVQVPLFKQENDARKLRESSIWEWRGPTQDEGDEAAAWLSAFLEKDVRLVRYLGESGKSSTVCGCKT